MICTVWLSLRLVQSKLQPRAVKILSYIVAGQLWSDSWKENRFAVNSSSRPETFRATRFCSMVPEVPYPRLYTSQSKILTA
jgi:hypothetical protein